MRDQTTTEQVACYETAARRGLGVSLPANPSSLELRHPRPAESPLA